MDIFSVLKDINMTKSFKAHKEDDFNKAYDPFMINRYLSMSPETVFDANFMNRYYSLPKHVQYLFLSSSIEKKDRFLKYVKSDREKEDSKMIKHLQNLFQVNKMVATDMMKTISAEEKETIKEMYEQKTIRKR